MANITRYLQDIKSAVYGYQVRDSIHDAIDIINKVGEKQINIGTAISAGDPKGSYYENSLYINTNTWKLLKCNGTTWVEVGSIRGAAGNGISSITGPVTVGLVDTYTINYDDGTSKTFDVTNGADGEDGDDGIGISSISKTATSGLVDTYTITYTDGTTTTFNVTNGANGEDGTDGQNGNVWGTGTALTGTGTRLTGYPGVVGDCYLNTESNNVYQCTTPGTATTAEWNYITNIKGQSGTGSGNMHTDVYAPLAIAAGYNNVVDTALTLRGLTAEINELNALDGVTGNVQTQLNNKATTTQLSDGLNAKINNPAASVEDGKVLTSNGDGTTRWSAPQVGSSSLHDLTDVNDTGKANDSVLKYNGTAWVPDNNIVPKTNKIPAGNGTDGQVLTSNGDGTASWEDPASGGHTLDTSVATVENTSSENEHVPSSYVLKQYANRFTYCVESILTANTNEITIPASGNEPIFEDDDATFEFMYEPNGTDAYPMTVARAQITTTVGQGKVKLTFSKAPTVNTHIRVDVTKYREAE